MFNSNCRVNVIRSLILLLILSPSSSFDPFKKYFLPLFTLPMYYSRHNSSDFLPLSATNKNKTILNDDIPYVDLILKRLERLYSLSVIILCRFGTPKKQHYARR